MSHFLDGVKYPKSPPPLVFRYRNHRGEEAVRRVLPGRVYHGTSPWHPTPQWLMDAFDLDRQDDRSFALVDILGFEACVRNFPASQQ